MKLGSNLQFLRKLHGGMTQERLAERMHVSRQTVSKWETGEAIPDVEKLLEVLPGAVAQAQKAGMANHAPDAQLWH